uniref:Interferon alpha-C-like n=1 Tax=Pogona vitticeps TaxID=103695 RepID=A0A6J0TC32_9SAUR
MEWTCPQKITLENIKGKKENISESLNTKTHLQDATRSRVPSRRHYHPDLPLQKPSHLFLSSMISKVWFLRICLLMAFSNEISSQGCNLHSRLQEANKNNLELLNNKPQSSIPVQCIDDVLNFSLNEESLTNIGVFDEENSRVTIQEILQQTSRIFTQNHSELSWDENSISAFLAGLDQQIQNLERCLSASPRSQQVQLTRLRVKRYFQKLSGLLKEKEYSQCSWEIVWIQVKQCFVQINQFIQRIPNEGRERQIS